MTTSPVPFLTGNAESDAWVGSTRGWFIGHFLPPDVGSRQDGRLEVKWGVHEAEESPSAASFNSTATTLALLISGEYEIGFPAYGKKVLLSSPGDYVLFQPKVVHTGRAVSNSTIVTIRWPSVAGDSVKA